MAAPKTQNPLFQRMQSDLFAKPAPGPDIGQLNAMNNAGVYMPGTFGASNAAANGTGADPFSAGMAPPAAPMAPVAPAPQAGDPASPSPADVFSSGIQAFAPTGLRESTLAANGQGVFGQGNVMAFSDGMNAQGGQKFSLGQVTPVGGPNAAPMTPANPIAPDQRAPAPRQPPAMKVLTVEEQQKRATAAGLPKGFVADPADPTKMVPIKGSSEEKDLEIKNLQLKKLQQDLDLKDKEAEGAVAKNEKAITIATEKAKLVTDTIGKALEKTGYFNQATGFIPFTEGADLAGLVDTIKANIGFEELNAMRQASPTGGALGQVAVKELEFLQAALGNLSLKQSPKQLRENLNAVSNHYNRWLKTTQGINPDAATFTPEKQKRLEELRAKLGKK